MLQYIQLGTTPATHTLQGTMRDMDLIIIPLEALMDHIQQTVLEIFPFIMGPILAKTTMQDTAGMIMVPELRMDHIQQAVLEIFPITMEHLTPLVITQLIIPLVIMMEIIIIQLTPHILVSQAITQQVTMQVIILAHIQLLITTPLDQLDQTPAQVHHIHLVTTLEHIHTPQLPLTLQQAQ